MNDHTTFHPEDWHERPPLIDAATGAVNPTEVDVTMRRPPSEPADLSTQLADAFGIPVNGSLFFAFGLVTAEMARLLELMASATDSMENIPEAQQVLEWFDLLRPAVIAEAVKS